MPYTIRKVKNKNCYTVKNSVTKVLHAKCTSLEKAKKQVLLLKYIKHKT